MKPSEQISCCGRTYSGNNYPRHIKTSKHQKWIRDNIPILDKEYDEWFRKSIVNFKPYDPDADIANAGPKLSIWDPDYGKRIPLTPEEIARKETEEYREEYRDTIRATDAFKQSRKYKDQLIGPAVSVEPVASTSTLYDRIKAIDGIKIQKQFGDNDRIVTLNIRIDNGSTVEDYRNNLSTFHQVLKEITRSHKISLSCRAKFKKQNDNSEKIHNIQSHMNVLLSHNQITDVLNKCFSDLVKHIEERYFEGSGLTLAKIMHMDLHIYMTKVKKGSCYVAFPFRTTAVINVQNDDNKCFLWSLLAALHPPVNDSVSRVSSYKKHESVIKIDKYPVQITDIPKIEMDNNLRINVFEASGNGAKITDYSLEPLYVSDKLGYKEIDILLYQEHCS